MPFLCLWSILAISCGLFTSAVTAIHGYSCDGLPPSYLCFSETSAAFCGVRDECVVFWQLNTTDLDATRLMQQITFELLPKYKPTGDSPKSEYFRRDKKSGTNRTSGSDPIQVSITPLPDDAAYGVVKFFKPAETEAEAEERARLEESRGVTDTPLHGNIRDISPAWTPSAFDRLKFDLPRVGDISTILKKKFNIDLPTATPEPETTTVTEPTTTTTTEISREPVPSPSTEHEFEDIYALYKQYIHNKLTSRTPLIIRMNTWDRLAQELSDLEVRETEIQRKLKELNIPNRTAAIG